ncbi:hypothetical protein QYE76_036271 [Lolium multiflorum]|uniref:No apical meristem-associated C-terminal domain-containing protein n=1 Tax=Lolium multiflorum TaxID=4521 RepID=A0AAD8R4L2_LOLMU|nr:hypothetical protein QYE76_036271 [Lolium multiflorum]
MTGARNLLDDLSAERAPPSMHFHRAAPPPTCSTMPTTVPYRSTEQAPQPPPVDTEEDTTGHPGSLNIEEEPLFAEELIQAAAAQARVRRVSKRTNNYTVQEDKMLVDAWLTIGQDASTGAEQKGTAFWRRIYVYFHEHQKYGHEAFETDRSDISLQKRWGVIQTECNKFQAAYDHVKRMPVSGMGMKDLRGLHELIAMTRAKEVELKAKEVELKRQAENNLIMNADLSTMSDAKRAWFEKRRKEILERPN